MSSKQQQQQQVQSALNMFGQAFHGSLKRWSLAGGLGQPIRPQYLSGVACQICFGQPLTHWAVEMNTISMQNGTAMAFSVCICFDS